MAHASGRQGQSTPSFLVTALVLSIGWGQMACIGPASAQSVEREGAAAAAQYDEGVQRMEQGDYRAAFEIYDGLIARYPGRAVLHFQRGLVRDRLGEHQAAIADFDEGLRLSPDDAKGYYARARAYVALRDSQRMVEDLDRALQLFAPDAPELPTAYQLRGIGRSIAGDQQGAVEDMRMAVELLMARGDVAGAERARQRLGRLETDPAEAQ